MAANVDFVLNPSWLLTADLPIVFTEVTAATVVAASGARGGSVIRTTTAATYVRKTFNAPSATHVAGFRFKTSALGGSQLALVTFADAGTAQLYLALNPDGSLSWVRGGNLATGGAIAAGVNNYIEVSVTIADSIGAGTCKVWVNGAEVPALTLAAGTDTKATANAYANSIMLGAWGGGGFAGNWNFEDIYHGTGTTPLGDRRMDLLVPNGDGTYSTLTPSTGTDHYALVDEATPNTTDYNSSSTVGNKDTYTLTDLTVGTGTIDLVAVDVIAAKTDAGLRTLSPMIRSNTTDVDATAVALALSYQSLQGIFTTDPNTAAAWTEAGVNAMQAGAKVAA